jgi:bis(5'-nucleosyl)-tetraphosphatase (symmetrical)
MTDWAIGDIQGCAGPFFRLLAKTQFNPERDRLWVVGDMINRGPDNLSIVRYIKNLGCRACVVLGNHDLHFLAVVNGARKLSSKDTLQDLLTAPDCADIVSWYRQQPLIQFNDQYLMCHAGLPPMWSQDQAIKLAQEVSDCLVDDQRFKSFINAMYGNQPSVWNASLQGNDRLRVITNYLTRMRFLDNGGRLELTANESPNEAPMGFLPWYQHPPIETPRPREILFGHWAALQGRCPAPGLHALDTGCVWGGTLTMMNLDSLLRISEPAEQ